MYVCEMGLHGMDVCEMGCDGWMNVRCDIWMVVGLCGWMYAMWRMYGVMEGELDGCGMVWDEWMDRKWWSGERTDGRTDGAG